jgi:hypothetical protein
MCSLSLRAAVPRYGASDGGNFHVNDSGPWLASRLPVELACFGSHFSIVGRVIVVASRPHEALDDRC